MFLIKSKYTMSMSAGKSQGKSNSEDDSQKEIFILKIILFKRFCFCFVRKDDTLIQETKNF